MNNLNLKLILEAVDKITAPVRHMTGRVRMWLKSISKAAGELGKKFDEIGKKFAEIGGFLTMRLTLPILGLGAYSIRSAGQVEELVDQLTYLAGGADKASAYVKGLQGYIDRFGLADVSDTVTQLEMAGYNLDGITNRVALLSGIAAGSKQPLAAITDQYISMRKAGKLSDGDLMAMQKARIPIVQELAKQLGKSEQQIYNMAANGKIVFSDYKKALQGLTEEGGRFAGAMEKRGRTINGIFTELKNTLSSVMAEFGEELWKQLDIGPKIKALGEGVRSLIKAFMGLPKWLKDVIIWLALITAAIGPLILLIGNLIIGIAGMLIVFSKMTWIFTGGVKGIYAVFKALTFLVTAIRAVGLAIVTNPIGLIITAIIALGAAVYMLIKHWDRVRAFFGELWSYLKSAFEAGVAGVMTVLQPLIDAVNTVVGGIGRIAGAAGNMVKRGWGHLFGDDQPMAGGVAASVGAAPLLRGSGAGGRVDAGGTIKIEVDDRRTRVVDTQSNDSRIQLRPATTGALMGGY